MKPRDRMASRKAERDCVMTLPGILIGESGGPSDTAGRVAQSPGADNSGRNTWWYGDEHDSTGDRSDERHFSRWHRRRARDDGRASARRAGAGADRALFARLARAL